MEREKSLQNVKRRLEAAGLSVEVKPIRFPGEEVKNALFVDTDYYGPYAPAETFEKIAIARRIANRAAYPFENETRGHYTALMIY